MSFWGMEKSARLTFKKFDKKPKFMSEFSYSVERSDHVVQFLVDLKLNEDYQF